MLLSQGKIRESQEKVWQFQLFDSVCASTASVSGVPFFSSTISIGPTVTSFSPLMSCSTLLLFLLEHVGETLHLADAADFKQTFNIAVDIDKICSNRREAERIEAELLLIYGLNVIVGQSAINLAPENERCS